MSKVILITGSTDGIGKLAALQLAKQGHQVFLHGRNANKLEQLIEEVKLQSNNPNIDGFVADFSDLDVVLQVADTINNKLARLDVLINNAGIFKSPEPITKDGLDICFAVNYLAPYILTNALLPMLKASNARIINLSSAAQSTVSLSALAGDSRLSTQEAYAQSKLALLMWSFHLAQDEQEISVIALNPGSLLNTNMVREAYGTHWSSADKGADIITQLAISTEHNGISGMYFDNDRGAYGEAHKDAYDATLIKELVQATEALLSA